MTVPESCRAVVFDGPGKPLRLVDVALPKLEAGEALVRIAQTTVCGSDLYTLKGVRNEPTPTILGHEAIGHLVAMSDNSAVDLNGEALFVGQRVTWSVAASCGECDRCARQLPQKCRSLVKYGHAVAAGRKRASGGFAEYILLQRGSAIVALPDDLPDDVACPANCATATVAACFRAAGAVNDRSVLIFGAGMLGLTASAFANSRAASSVTMVDRAAQRLVVASRFGATRTVLWDSAQSEFQETLESLSLPHHYDVVLELSGAAACVQAAIDSAQIGGSVILAGSVLPTESVSLDPQTLVRRWLTIRGVHNYAPRDLQEAVRFLADAGKYPFADLVEGHFPLDDANEAIDFAMKKRPIRTALVTRFAGKDSQHD